MSKLQRVSSILSRKDSEVVGISSPRYTSNSRFKMADAKVDSGYQELCVSCEQMELDGVATAEVYVQLLAVYLLQNDVCNAKFLWKRIPDDIKASSPELAKLWGVGCHMWKRNFPEIYKAMKQEWSPSIQPIVTALQARLQERAFDLVANAYTSIKADDFAAFMGMSVESAINIAVSHQWTADRATGTITPKKPEPTKKDITITSEQELALLTDYVSFLEN